MEDWGNGRANEYYEANVPPQVPRPKEGDSVRTVEKFIRDKYEFKRFIGKIPEKRSREEDDHNSKPEVAAPQTITAKNQENRRTTHSVPVSAPAPVAAPSVAQKPQESLLDLLDDPAPAPAPSNASFASNNDFGDFTSAAPAPAPTITSAGGNQVVPFL